MMILTAEIRAQLEANRGVENAVPCLKLFNPVGAATWLATEIGEDGDTLFGLADLGFGCPELGYFSLREITSLRLPFGLKIERDMSFETDKTICDWAEKARRLGSLTDAEQIFVGLRSCYAEDSK